MPDSICLFVPVASIARDFNGPASSGSVDLVEVSIDASAKEMKKYEGC